MTKGMAVRGGVAALMVAAAASSWMSPAGADDAKPWELFHPEMGPAAENLSPYRIRITSGCADEISYRYWVGRKGPEGSQWKGPEYDARGPQASATSDFVPTSGSFSVSKSKPFILNLKLIDDEAHEVAEYVPILIESYEVVATFAGDISHCAEDHTTTTQTELAFTIEDNDAAPSAAAAGGGPSSATGGRPAAKAGAPSGPEQTPTDPRPEVAIIDRASTDLDAADGVSLVGLHASAPRPRRRPDDQGTRSWPGVGIGLALVAGAGVSLRRRFSSW